MTDALTFIAAILVAAALARYSGILAAAHRAGLSDRALAVYAVGLPVVVGVGLVAFLRAAIDGDGTVLPLVALAVAAGMAAGFQLELRSLRRHAALEDQLNEALKDTVVTLDDGTVTDPRDSDGRHRILTPAQERQLRRAQRRRGHR
jgi:hypothetical protein